MLAILLVVSSITAPKVKAPTIPQTPTPGKSGTTPLPRASATTGAKATAGKGKSGKKKSISMESGHSLAAGVLASRAMGANETASPDGRLIAYFEGRGDAYAGSPLVIRDTRTGASRQIGRADPLVSPVWSADGRRLLTIQVRGTARFPGAEWSLVQWTTSGRSRVLVQRPGLAMVPLGWHGDAAMYLVATATDTSIYRVVPGGAPTFVSILVSQVVTAARLSPDGQAIAFTVPTNCGYCNLDVIDLNTLRTLYGPSGAASGWTFAWTRDTAHVLTATPRGLGIMDAGSGAVRYVVVPRGLPRIWEHPFRASISDRGVLLMDSITGTQYRTGR